LSEDIDTLFGPAAIETPSLAAVGSFRPDGIFDANLGETTMEKRMSYLRSVALGLTLLAVSGELFEYAYNQAATLTGRPPIGDANTSGIVNVSDAINILEDFLGLAPTLATDENTDINRNGSTDALDATFLYQEIQGNIPFIPFP